MNRRQFIGNGITLGGGLMLLSLGNNIVFAGNSEDKLSLLSSETNYFPVTAKDKNGVIWIASLTYLSDKRYIQIYRVIENTLTEYARIESEKYTGLATPSIAGLDNGCLLTFAIEQNDKWDIAYTYISNKQKSININYIHNEGNSNISPAIAVVKKGAWIIWESNAGKYRGIYSCKISGTKIGAIQRISDDNANSYNPALVALSNGNIFAAWDTFRDKQCNIYGAWFKNGKWQKEEQITNNARIERHPNLAINSNDEVWMAWQAQSYGMTGIDRDLKRVNKPEEQRIVVAKIQDKTLFAPVDLFNKVSTKGKLLVRPVVSFDDKDNLWLTARFSEGITKSWFPVLWQYAGSEWSDAEVLFNEEGRWHPVNVMFNDTEAIPLIQFDDLPKTWDNTRGIYPNWRSGIKIVQPNLKSLPKKVELITEPLRMPETNFSLEEKIELIASDLPSKKIKIKETEIQLFFGDFHDHTDISVCERSQNPPGHDLFANERDIENIDFAAITDHGYNIDLPQWNYNGEQTRNNHDPERFITFLAQEWTSSYGQKSGGYGHHNLIFLDPYYNKFYDSYDGKISPAQLWKELEGVEFICIPHQLADWEHTRKSGGKWGNPPKDWSFTDEKLQPVAEIFQIRGSYEYLGCPRQAKDGAPMKKYYLQDAWEQKIIIGVIASPDHGGGNGKMGVWAEKLTREEIFKAVRARHTYGTTGSKIGLLFKNEHGIMGDKLSLSSQPGYKFSINAWSLQNIKEVVIFRNNQIVYKVNPGIKEVETKWEDTEPLKNDFSWYYARIQCENDELAWSSPIWYVAE